MKLCLAFSVLVLLLPFGRCSDEPPLAARFFEGYTLEGAADWRRGPFSSCIEFYWQGGEPAVMSEMRQMRARNLKELHVPVLRTCEAVRDDAISACVIRFRVTEIWVHNMREKTGLPEGLEWPESGGFIVYHDSDDHRAGRPKRCLNQQAGAYEEQLEAFFFLLAPPPKY